MDNFNITENFTFFELTDSDGHPELVERNREVAFASPSIMLNIDKLCEDHLEFIRRLYNDDRPLIILSGYRNPVLNEAVGGSIYSQHMKGQAADLLFRNALMTKHFYEAVESGEFPQMYHQVIWYPSQNFVHYGMATGYNDGQCWIHRG